MAFKTIKGTFDVLPAPAGGTGQHEYGSAAWRGVEAVVRGVMERFGAREIRTPILEPTELIARGVGEHTDIVSKEMFAFEREDTAYVLRPEVTAPVMRAYLQHYLAQQGGVQRLYYIGPCFRAERPQKGRYRQFHQVGAEIIGTDDARADAEIIALTMAIYEAFGLTETTLLINTLGDAEARPKYREALHAYFAPYAGELSEASRRRLASNPLRLLDTKNPRERELVQDAPLLIDYVSDDARDRYDAVRQYLTDFGIAYVEDPLLVRGLDYYAHTLFELQSGDLGAQSALAGGGRYDGLASDLGAKQPVPAIGFAAGIERLFLALEANGYAFTEDPVPDAFLVALGDDAQRFVLAEAQRLRARGLRVMLDLKGRSMKAQMREANRQNVPRVVVIGSDELAAREATVRDMATSEQTTVRFDALAETLGA